MGAGGRRNRGVVECTRSATEPSIAPKAKPVVQIAGGEDFKTLPAAARENETRAGRGGGGGDTSGLQIAIGRDLGCEIGQRLVDGRRGSDGDRDIDRSPEAGTLKPGRDRVGAADAAPPVTVLISVLPAGLDEEVTLPNSVLAIRSPAATWNAVELELKASDFFPSPTVTSEALRLAFLKAVASGLTTAPAEVMAVLMEVTRLSAVVTQERLTATLIRPAPPKPGPRK